MTQTGQVARSGFHPRLPCAQVVGWTSNYQETLLELGLEEGEVGFPQGPDRGSTLLVSKYISRIRATLHTWFVNILEVRARTGCPFSDPASSAPASTPGSSKSWRCAPIPDTNDQKPRTP